MSTPGMYDSYKDGMLEETLAATMDLTVDNIECHLIDDADYTANFATDNFLDDVAGAARVASSNALDSPTVSAGVFDAADEVLTSVSGDGIESVLVNGDNGGAETADPLLVILDLGGTTTPNGNDITIQWDAGANKIFALN